MSNILPWDNIIPDNNNTNPAIVPDTNQFEGSFKTQRTALELALTKGEGKKFSISEKHLRGDLVGMPPEKKKGNLAIAGLIGLALVI